jgi:molybdopterin molybdotransferase
MAIARSSISRIPTMISPAEAYRIVLDVASPLPAARVPWLEALGKPLAETVRADRSYPPFRRAMMDGYAVSLASAGQTIDVIGRQTAGAAPSPQVVTALGCVEIMTGAACPLGTEAVVQKEHVRFDGNRVILPAVIEPGRHIAEPGSECAQGEAILRAGDLVTPLAIAALASVGRQDVAVVPAPRMAVIVTGEELASGSQDLRDGQIRDANGPMLMALAVKFGLAPPECRRVGDDLAAIQAALEASIDCDLVVLSGGASVGAFDFVPGALADWGAEILFHKVRQKPGKPLLLARRDASLVFGLPGNPLACHFCFCRYVQAATARMCGHGRAITGEGQLASPLRPDRGRTFFVPAGVERASSSPTGWSIHPLPGVSSADIFHSHQANAYVELPPGAEELPAGTVAAVNFFAQEA